MTDRQRAVTRSTVKLALATTLLTGGALFTAGLAAAEPAPLVPPGDPAAPIPGQPVAVNPDELVAAPPAPPPVGAPPVPQMTNPAYGQGSSGGGLGYIKDLWNAARSNDPMAAFSEAGTAGMPTGAPPGAGPAPKLPPGYMSLTDPASSTPSLQGTPQVGGPPLPPGFVSLSDPNPPAEALPIGAPGAAPAGVPAPGAPAPPPVPAPAPMPPTIIQQGPLG
ncbi:hypothetical protein [Mycolicibacterium frederiksbergense]|uniref:hypothetical protein n=1 Tax=Mycolicibacterium frederiksbergense TaxID=117567 RepID=UPI00265BD72C|nr:hypothetical protein [Mycolicibacterium frederiksbergense]MDO0976595.1 hypothetical protein [Mycolicibacterium frederiksbergense]